MYMRRQPRGPEEVLGRVCARAECSGELSGRDSVRGMAAAALGDDPCVQHRSTRRLPCGPRPRQNKFRAPVAKKLVVILQTGMSDDPCPICLGEITRRTTTSCGHVFCERCIGVALQRDQDSACPMCRARVTSFAVYDGAGPRTWRVVRGPGERITVRTARVHRQDRSYMAVYVLCCVAMMTLVWILGDTACAEMHSHTPGIYSCTVGSARCYFDGTPREAGIECNSGYAPS